MANTVRVADIDITTYAGPKRDDGKSRTRVQLTFPDGNHWTFSLGEIAAVSRELISIITKAGEQAMLERAVEAVWADLQSGADNPPPSREELEQRVKTKIRAALVRELPFSAQGSRPEKT